MLGISTTLCDKLGLTLRTEKALDGAILDQMESSHPLHRWQCRDLAEWLYIRTSYSCGKEHCTSVDLIPKKFATPEGAKDETRRDPTQGVQSIRFR
jgi:hypothetical protein